MKMLFITLIFFAISTMADKTIFIFAPKALNNTDTETDIINDENLFLNMKLPPNTNLNMLVHELRDWRSNRYNSIRKEETSEFKLPTHTISDYVEMSFYVLLTLFGG